VRDGLALQVGLKTKLLEIDELVQTGRRGEAIPLLYNLTQTHPSALTYIKYATVVGDLGDGPTAERYLRDALRMDPQAERGYHLLGLVIFMQAEAQKSTDRAGAAARFREAAGHFQTAVKLKPDNADAHRCLARALDELGETDEAVEHLRLAIVCRPEQHAGHLHLGEILARTGQKDEAIRHLRTAVELAPANDPRAKALLESLTKGKP
jgi:Flp pilus assembly protein TadD